MAGRLTDKVMIVTGGASGIGRGLCEIAAEEGARIMIADINLDAARGVADAIGGEAEAVAIDLASGEESAKAVIDAAVSRFGKLDCLVNAAADTLLSSTRDQGIETMDFEVWDKLMAVNLRGMAMMIKHAIPALRASGGGSIVNLASGSGIQGSDGPTAYGATKAGVINLTQYTATQHGKESIRCNAIAPGLIVTPATEDTYARGRLGDIMHRHTLTPRLGRPSDIAWAIVWLASDEAEFVTGQCISVDGGIGCHSATWADIRDMIANG